MSAIAINAADLSAPNTAFVAVKTAQITVSATASKTGKDFSSLFNRKEESVQIEPEATEAKAVKKEKGANELPVKDDASKNISETVIDKVETDAVNTTQTEKTDQVQQTGETETVVPENGTEMKVTVTAALKISVNAAGYLKKAPVFDDQEAQDPTARFDEILEALSTLLQRFAEILDITVEELEGSYEKLDFSFTDMISETKLPQLMIGTGQCKELEQVLFDDIPSQCYNDLKEALSDMFAQLDTTVKELAETVTDNLFKVTASQTEILPKEFVKLITGTQSEAQEIEEQEVPDTELKTPTFTVTKENATADGKETDNGTATAEGSESIIAKDTKEAGTRKSDKNDGFEEFIRGMENAVKVNDTKEIPMIEGKPDVREIVMRVVDAIKVNLSPDKTSIELSLSPQSLGKISLYITSKDGNLTARIATENEVTKQALESQLEMLKETIAEQGIKVEAIEVSVSGFTFADSNNAQKGDSESDNKKTGATGRKQVRDGEAGIQTQDEPTTESTPVPEGSTVNYVA
ncbi:MAG: flagellar hook-length control protein FliK [Lachnospiraceae bacterium]|nr:flagellar hook-length control protein FliK [Lachnospiraceae bacterium]